jgi:hypothetical protein
MAKVEFDGYADTYYEEHKKNVEITGEAPEYFAEYRIADLAHHLYEMRSSLSWITDWRTGNLRT